MIEQFTTTIQCGKENKEIIMKTRKFKGLKDPQNIVNFRKKNYIILCCKYSVARISARSDNFIYPDQDEDLITTEIFNN